MTITLSPQQLRETITEELPALTGIVKGREYTFLSALADCTGVCTLYSMGADLAHRARFSKVIDLIESMENPYKEEHAAWKFDRWQESAGSVLHEEKGNIETSLLARAAYVSSMALLIAGASTIGALGMFGIAGSFLFKAGYNSVDNVSKHQVRSLENIVKGMVSV